METIKVINRLTNEEKETTLVYDYIDKVWEMYSTVPKHFNKAIKQGWCPIRQYVYEDGTICGMTLTASERAVTIRNVEAKQMSEKQMGNLSGSDD